jgi:hypothetical protein
MDLTSGFELTLRQGQSSRPQSLYGVSQIHSALRSAAQP